MKNNNFAATVVDKAGYIGIRMYAKNDKTLFAEFTRDKSTKVWSHENSAMTAKDRQYVLNIAKFIREYTVDMKANTWAKKMEKIAKTVNELESAQTFRNLSSNIRKAYDDGSVEYFDRFFYEGQRKRIAETA